MTKRALNLRAAGIAFCLISSGPVLKAMAEPPQNVYWTAAQSGTWTDPTKWTSEYFYPQNDQPNLGDRYRAIIDAVGSPYVVTMDQRFATFSLDEFVLDSANVTFRHGQGTFRPSHVDLRAGTYYFGTDAYNGIIEDATIDIRAGARFDFAPYMGNPWQPTGRFTRCTINGDLTLDREASGVLFEDAVTLNGNINLVAPSSRVWFAGTQFRFDNASIVASSAATVATSCFEKFTFGTNARLLGNYSLESFGSPGHLFVNEGLLQFSGYSRFQNLAVDNRGTLEVGGPQLKIHLQGCRFANYGEVDIGPDADFVINAEATTINEGTIALVTGSTLTTLRECRLTSDSIIEFELKHGLQAGLLDLGDSRYQSELDGTLRIVTDDPMGFVPGDRFRLVQCENFIGGFSSYELALIGNGLVIQIEVVPADGVFAVVRCRADINRDGIVDVDDYSAFADLFDIADSGVDFNGDGFVNGDDYDAFAEHFEAGC